MNGHELHGRKPRRGGVEIRLIVFGALAVLLIVFSLFSEYLTPYDPYLQDLSNAKLPPPGGASAGHGPLWQGYAVPCHCRQPNQHFFHAHTGGGHYRAWNHYRGVLRLERGVGRTRC